MELRHILSLEMTRIEFFGREITSMEAENQRLQNQVVEYLKVLDQLELLKLENGFLRRKVKKLWTKRKDQSRVMREHNLKIEAIEAEISSNRHELERKTDVIQELEDEVGKLRTVIEQLQEEKNELLTKLELAEKSASSISKIEAEGITMEDYNKLSNELEQIQNDRAAEVKELVYLRWSNACLRHQLTRSRDQQEQNQERKNHLELDIDGSGENVDYGLDHELDGLVLEHGESCLGITTTSQACPKRLKLLQKFRRWVEGKLDEKQKHEIKCFGRHSVSHGAEEQNLEGRKSCSSA
ncbi:hypothetical protein L1049_008641 [Liquidambar formosana]|uniref:Protein CHUP1, chloroplastic n=1 Tax=Liquidambar formosana TaxID=63359 RepID=A0AAP0X4Q6_LIQFO